MNLRETTYLLLSERVPLGYEDAEKECRKLADLFIRERHAGQTTISPLELEALATHLVGWAREKGYNLMDDPLPPYGMPKVGSLGHWKPRASDLP